MGWIENGPQKKWRQFFVRQQLPAKTEKVPFRLISLKYCPVKAKHVSREFPLDNMYMIKANSTAVTKITSVQWITPDNKNSKQVVNSLEK